MGTDKPFNQILQDIASHIDTVGDEIRDQISGQSDQGEPIQGYVCQHGHQNYSVVGSSVWDYFRLTYDYNAVKDEAIAGAASEAMAAGEVGEVEIQLTEEMLHEARERLVSRVDEETFNGLRLDVIKTLSQSECALELQTDDNRVVGFTLGRKIFVYEDDFAPSDFNRAVQTLVSLGYTGSQLISDTLGIEAVEGLSSGSLDVADGDSRMFQ